jgi:iron-sulfur cluster repair protein YtfE (RIC family)
MKDDIIKNLKEQFEEQLKEIDKNWAEIEKEEMISFVLTGFKVYIRKNFYKIEKLANNQS